MELLTPMGQPRAALTPFKHQPRKQHGAVLIIALLVLVLMSYAAASVIRATDTGGVISGNFAFRQATTHASDQAITAALNTLASITPDDGGNAPISNRYFEVRQSIDDLGVPTTVDWGEVVCNDENGVLVADCTETSAPYRVQYIVERQCSAVPDLSDLESIKSNCDYVSPAGTSVTEIAVLYRVIIRARGPRGTNTFFEVMLSGPATS